uniref:Uncharacterized protein n=1 Tax=Kwoniella bestiolae CBS 10118 TaxID=1296100 RepID=A0A1B9GB97_9TREE|nr:hypothetical protein I302_03150 [Kwoniella bestiolae CBS 10118]OCF28294.1 hypothetical protein I302_03150 [Kwoniella bestiolae CBS 10118]
MWNNPATEGDNCVRKMSEIRSAHTQIKAGEAIRKGTIASANKATGQNFKNGQNGKYKNNGQTGGKR